MPGSSVVRPGSVYTWKSPTRSCGSSIASPSFSARAMTGLGGPYPARLTLPASSWISACSARSDAEESTAEPVTRAVERPRIAW